MIRRCLHLIGLLSTRHLNGAAPAAWPSGCGVTPDPGTTPGIPPTPGGIAGGSSSDHMRTLILGKLDACNVEQARKIDALQESHPA